MSAHPYNPVLEDRGLRLRLFANKAAALGYPAASTVVPYAYGWLVRTAGIRWADASGLLPENWHPSSALLAQGAMSEPLSREPNTPIEALLRHYEAEGCDHSNLEWVVRAALRCVETMADCPARCLLHVLAAHAQRSFQPRPQLPCPSAAPTAPTTKGDS